MGADLLQLHGIAGKPHRSLDDSADSQIISH